MSATPDKKILDVLVRISKTEPVLLDWLRSRLESHKSALVNTTDDAQYRIIQGKAQEMSVVLDTIQRAEDSLKNRTA